MWFQKLPSFYRSLQESRCLSFSINEFEQLFYYLFLSLFEHHSLFFCHRFKFSFMWFSLSFCWFSLFSCDFLCLSFCWKSLNAKINYAYYLAKYERPYSDYPIIFSWREKNWVKVGTSYLNNRAATNITYHIAEVTCETLQKDKAKANFYSVLSNGSTGSCFIQQELMDVLFLNEGNPTLKCSRIESVSNADLECITETIKASFACFEISNFTSNLLGLNADWASANMRVNRGLGILIKQ